MNFCLIQRDEVEKESTCSNVLYDSYFINFASLSLNGFIFLFLCGSWNFGRNLWTLLVCLWVVLFCFVGITLLEEGMEGRKMSMEIILYCIKCSCCIGQFLLNWDQSSSIWRTSSLSPYLLTSSYTAANANLNVSIRFCS